MIETPVEFSATLATVVNAFDGLPRAHQQASFWADPSTNEVKSHIKTHYILEQSNRCCYCDHHLPTNNHRMWDIEHIVPRLSHPQFMFRPDNLAVSCPDCNREKGTFQMLVNARLVRYPVISAAFKLVHPHFDNFKDHILRVNYVYVPKTKKGTETIRRCNLLRFAQKYIDWPNAINDSRFENEVNDLFSQHDVKGAVGRIAAQLPIRTD
ncbi:HNH endonuclease [Cryobacterium sp. M96]|uniref:HNH endonuclease n=1 Tax=Cryobacterium sp. M96 TaxID=2048295 RepID=UPI0011B025C5|nr:HNH endonuclease signature motif containing protein [Cryobacterium sp. M96]